MGYRKTSKNSDEQGLKVIKRDIESVYMNALILEIKEMGFQIESEKKIKVKYKDRIVGDFYGSVFSV